MVLLAPMLGSLNDEQLAIAFRAREATAMRLAYDRYGGAVYRMALKMLGNTGEAEDLAQEVFLEAWQGNRFDPSRGALLTFLLTLTRSRALNRQQQNKSRQQRQERYSTDRTQATEDLPFQTAAVAEVSERVRQALASLPEPRRTVLELAYYRGLSQSEVAAALNLPLGTVKTRTRQALVSLRERLADLVDASP